MKQQRQIDESENWVEVQSRNNVCYLYLKRNSTKNALNPEFVKQISIAIDSLSSDTKCLVITAQDGKTFCAGADLNWVRDGLSKGKVENYEESLQLVHLLKKVRELPFPVISFVEGAAVGAGAGIMLESDFAIVSGSAKLSFSEVKIGVVPVAIIEKVLDVFPTYYANQLLLTGKRITGEELLKHNITDMVFSSVDVGKNMLDRLVQDILSAKPNAIKMTKRLMQGTKNPKLSDEEIASEIANLRETEEAKNGIAKFFAK